MEAYSDVCLLTLLCYKTNGLNCVLVFEKEKKKKNTHGLTLEFNTHENGLPINLDR